MTFDFGGATLTLLADKAIYWEEQETLILSDVHLGKTAAFRAKGVPLPEGETEQDLKRISTLVENNGVRELIVVGDLFHSETALPPTISTRFADWLKALPAKVRLTVGNHDRRAGSLAHLGNLQEEPTIEKAGLLFCHDPAHLSSKSPPAICGHLHPVVYVQSPRRTSRMRLPAYVANSRRLILPSFGSFTGGHPYSAGSDERIMVVAGDSVVEIPHELLSRR